MSRIRRSLAASMGNLAAACVLCAGLLITNQAFAAQAAAQQPAQQAVTAQPPVEASAPNTTEQQEPAPVADSLFSQTYQACMDEAAGTTTTMQDCMAAEQQRLETRLAAQRTKVAAGLNPERLKAFNEALSAWDILRKSGSLAMYDPDGGTLSPLMASLWYLEQTARMTHWVDGMLENVDP
ncbi:MAG: DUF1311 domain-containing protein [Desulfovibrio sp.]|uniref:lysozyme inhibitor LprI family protein n=1 Tax=Desulfovibrio sp. TaxID=885 RepID=UPI00135EAF29|nr:lysozyme inhibitor LprI family protein [Desulfovibrio sp.]MTJ91670.1 DUF1311 domain-containing protein [Desulfovibrio sp.]